MDIAQVLLQNPIFMDLPKEKVRALAAVCELRNYSRGQQVFRDGEYVTGFYQTVTGLARMTKKAPDNREVTVRFFPPGDVFGEPAIFSRDGYPTDAYAAVKSQVLFIPKAPFVRLLQTDWVIAEKYMARLFARIKGHINCMALVTIPNAHLRVIHLLLEHLNLESQDSDGWCDFAIPASRLALATGAGFAHETMSRTLNELERKGLIELGPQVVNRVNKPRLLKFVEDARACS